MTMTERCDRILALIDAATDPTTEAAQTAAAVSEALERMAREPREHEGGK